MSSSQRREFLCALPALTAGLLLPARVHAAQIKAIKGAVSVNGKRARMESAIKPGDVVVTGPGGRVAFVVGEDAFLLREKSRLELHKSATGGGALLGGLRILSGALLGVFGKGSRQLTTATATIGIRGTGIYIEASREQTYLCTCYGEVQLRDQHSQKRRTIVSGYHTPAMIYAKTVDGRTIGEAKVKNHTDDELTMLEALVGRVSPVKERAKLKAPEPEVINAPRAASPQSASPPQPAPVQAAPTPPPAPGASAPATAPVPSPAVSPTRSEVLDWRLPPPKDVPRR